MNTLTVPAGTQAKPTLVPTIYKERTMGCICKYIISFMDVIAS